MVARRPHHPRTSQIPGLHLRLGPDSAAAVGATSGSAWFCSAPRTYLPARGRVQEEWRGSRSSGDAARDAAAIDAAALSGRALASGLRTALGPGRRLPPRRGRSPQRLPSVSRACRAPWLRLLRVRSAPAREAEDAHGPAGEVGAAVPSGFWPCWCLDGQKEALPRARLAAFVRASSLGSLGRARGLDWPLPAPWPLTRSSHPPAAGGDGPVQLREGRLAWLLRPEGCGPRAPFRCRWGPAWLLGPTAVAVFHLFEAPVRVGLHSPPPPWEAGLLATTLLLRRPHTCAGDCAPGPVMKS